MAIGHKDERAKSEGEKRGRVPNRLIFAPAGLLFFSLCFLYLWLVVEPNLIYYCFGTILPDAPDFATGWTFLRDSLAVPGGFATYAAGFLSLGFHQAWLGAGIILAAGWCLAELTRRHLRMAGLARAWVPASLPAIALFLIYSNYNHPLTACLAASLGLFLSLIFERLPLRGRPARIVAYCLMAVACLWIGGAGTLMILAAMTVIYGVFLRRDWVTAVVALPAGIAIAWVLASYVFLISTSETLLTLTPFAPSATAGLDSFLAAQVYFLYGFVPIVVPLVLLGKWAFAGLSHKSVARSKKSKGKEKHSAMRRARASWAIIRELALSGFLIVLMGAGLYVSHKELRKPYVLSNYYSRRKNWDKIIELGYHLPKGKANPFVSHDIIRAMYHTGRLPYDMFRHPLTPEALLLTQEKKESDLTQWKLCDIFLELGHVNMAQKLASELVSTKDHFGAALEKLAWIGIIKRQPDTARVYLEALKRDPMYRGRAESLLHGLDDGFTPEQAADIARIRSCMRDEEAAVTGAEPVDETLSALLEHNPRNKMAFEYLMACYLLTGRVDKVVENAGRLKDLGYQRIPTLYEEAMVICFGARRQQVDLARFPISPETLRRYETFAQMTNALGPGNQPAVLGRLIRDFGASYFFYYTFGRVGQ